MAVSKINYGTCILTVMGISVLHVSTLNKRTCNGLLAPLGKRIKTNLCFPSSSRPHNYDEMLMTYNCVIE